MSTEYIDYQRRILKLIETSWLDTDASIDFLESMRQSLFNVGGENREFSRISKWSTLPGLCAQAVGGNANQVVEITSAWLLYYTAAHLMDAVVDQDEPDLWWSKSGPAMAINTATGLYFTGNRILLNLSHKKDLKPFDDLIIDNFYKAFIQMSGGQHREIAGDINNLVDYWKLADDKSGAFFELACFSGALIGCKSPERAEFMGEFGRNMGVMIQIRDDLGDINPVNYSQKTIKSRELRISLPVVYGLTVLEQRKKESLNNLIDKIDEDSHVINDIFKILDTAGVVVYVLSEIERFKQQALIALNSANPDLIPGEKLQKLVESLSSFKD